MPRNEINEINARKIAKTFSFLCSLAFRMKSYLRCHVVRGRNTVWVTKGKGSSVLTLERINGSLGPSPRARRNIIILTWEEQQVTSDKPLRLQDLSLSLPKCVNRSLGQDFQRESSKRP